jgi:hypothetical protein
MIAETAPLRVADGKPNIHVWMTLSQAAETLRVGEPVVSRQIEWGELESRVTADGSREALVCLPRRASDQIATAAQEFEAESAVGQLTLSSVVRSDGESEDAAPPDDWASVAATLLPAMRKLPPMPGRNIHRTHRSAQFAWTAAALMLFAVCASTLMALRAVTVSRVKYQSASGRLHQTTDQAAMLAAERNRLKQQLTEANQVAAEAQAELVVDRKVEDTLFKAALAARAASAEQKSRVFADVSR